MNERKAPTARIMFGSADDVDLDNANGEAGTQDATQHGETAHTEVQQPPNEHLRHLQDGGCKLVFGCFNVTDGQALHGAGLADALPVSVEIGKHTVNDPSNGVKLLAVQVYLNDARGRLNFREDKIQEVIDGLIDQLECLQDEDQANWLDNQLAYRAQQSKDEGIVQVIGFSQKSWENTGHQMVAYIGHAIQGRPGLLVRGDRSGVPSPKEEGQIVWRLVHVFRNVSGRSATAIVANDPEYLKDCLASLRRQLSAAQQFNKGRCQSQTVIDALPSPEAKRIANELRRSARRA